jgi:hypothetical protein
MHIILYTSITHKYINYKKLNNCTFSAQAAYR